eukprot:jgi/Botrbrau1/14869/Bobra.0298s0003.1
MLTTNLSRPPPAFKTRGLSRNRALLKLPVSVGTSDPGTGKLLPDRVLGGELSLLLTAGTDTSSLTTTWTLFLVSQHPEVEAKIVEELRQHGLLACQQHTNGRDPTFDDLSQLHYLNAVIKESMRLKPVAAYTSAKLTTRDVVLGGRYHLPAGTSITVMGSATYRDPTLWDRPKEFVPERWLEGNPEFCSFRTVHAQDGTVAKFGAKGANGESSGTMPRKFFPFSLGHRDCVGRNLGNMVVVTLLTVLYSNLTFRLADEMGGVEQVDAGEILFFTLSPGKSLNWGMMDGPFTYWIQRPRLQPDLGRGPLGEASSWALERIGQGREGGERIGTGRKRKGREGAGEEEGIPAALPSVPELNG